MANKDYTTDITIDATAQEAFQGINNVAGWWSRNFEGDAQKTGDVFTVHFGETNITVKITEILPNEKIVWHVVDCYKHWLKDKKEWKGTEMTWNISPSENGTHIGFVHTGLVPGIECYNGCEKAWNYYINESLVPLLTEGKGKPE